MRKLFLLLLLLLPEHASSYAILTHEAVINASWKGTILPILRNLFPDSNEDSLQKAIAYAYGGAIMPDMGFFPFGSKFFTDLIHYTRGADFTKALIDESQNLNEFAFALGALAHYNADNYGHPIGVNTAVPLVYSKVKRKFGDTATYINNPIDHRRMEFAFDVLQVARGNYSQDSYADFIDFEVSKDLMQRAFLKTYGLRLETIFVNLDLAISSLRFSVRNMFPLITQAAWINKSDEIKKLNLSITDKKQFRYRMKGSDYRKRWNTPVRATTVAVLIKIMPKVIGPARILRFKMPSADAEQFFVNSFDSVLSHYAMSIDQLYHGKLSLRNRNYDSGHPIHIHDYLLVDETYYKLLQKLNDDQYANVTTSIVANILEFYEMPGDSSKARLAFLFKELKKKPHSI